jgi:DNA-binding beta-propeller fold protein YncE
MHRVSVRRDLRLLAVVSASITLALVAIAAFAARAQAAELVYWNNYRAEPQTISVAEMAGSGSLLNLSGVDLKSPEGMAIDSVTGRLYVASATAGADKKGEIQFANLDGSGAGVFGAPGAPVDEPYGVVVDPATRTIYWANSSGGNEDKGSIAWAKLDGSAGGTLNTAGATLDGPYKIGLDPVNGRVYWGSYPDSGDVVLSYANVNNTGGGDLSISPAPESAYAFAVDPAAGRLYWSEGDDDRFAFTGLLGGSRSILDTTGAVVDSSYGFAIDPTLNKIYWPNYGNGDDPVNGLGFASVSGGGGGNVTPTAPFNGAQDLLVLKSPTGTGAPTVTRDAANPAALSCSQGSWAGDFAGSFVYQAPQSLGYQWTLNGAAIAGATASTLTATAPGSYACTVTGTNHAGSAAQGSATAEVKAAKVLLTVKKKAKADPGDLVSFKVTAVNQGELSSQAARICVKLPKAAKDDLRKPKCKKLAPLAALSKRTAKVKVKVKPAADEGAAKMTFQVKGTPGKGAKSKIIVR